MLCYVTLCYVIFKDSCGRAVMDMLEPWQMTEQIQTGWQSRREKSLRRGREVLRNLRPCLRIPSQGYNIMDCLQERGVEKKKKRDDFPRKDGKGSSSIRPTLWNVQSQRWINKQQWKNKKGSLAQGVSRTRRYHLDLKWTQLNSALF